jgi:hypothetical protein
LFIFTPFFANGNFFFSFTLFLDFKQGMNHREIEKDPNNIMSTIDNVATKLTLLATETQRAVLVGNIVFDTLGGRLQKSAPSTGYRPEIKTTDVNSDRKILSMPITPFPELKMSKLANRPQIECNTKNQNYTRLAAIF